MYLLINRLTPARIIVGIALILALIVLILTSSSQAAVYGETETSVRTVADSVEQFQFSLQTAPLAFDAQGQATIAGLDATIATPGAPAVPFYTALIALPPEATADVHVEVAGSVTRKADILPAATVADEDGLATALLDGGVRSIESFGLAYEPDPTIYSQDADYPEALFTVSEPMYVRDLRMVQLNVYPVRTNPVAGTVTQVYDMHVTVRFEGADFSELQPARSAAMRGVQERVLNYDSAESGNWFSLPRSTQNATGTALPVGETAYKIAIDTDGIYELSRADLQAAGMPVSSVNPNTFEMMYRGEAVAFQFIGDNDNSFESGESVRFYGWRYDVDYTDPMYNSATEHYPNRIERQHILGNTDSGSTTGGTNYFWLWAGGTPTHITSRANQLDAPPVDSVRVAVTAEGDNGQHPSFTNAWDTFENEADSWYWTTLNTSGRTKPIELPHPDPTGADADLLIEVQSTGTGSHQVEISMAATTFTSNWTGRYSLNAIDQVPANQLVHGTNDVTVKRLSASDVKWQRITVMYDRLLIADNDQLLFKDLTGGRQRFDIDDFSLFRSEDIVVWDVTDVSNPQAISMGTGSVIGNNPYTYQIGSDHAAGTRFAVANTASVKTPLAVEAYDVVDLKPAQGATWMAITHGDFKAKTQQLADYRRSSAGGSYSTQVVDVADVFNQYGYGLPVPKAIQEYIEYALSWSTAPEYLLLVGDSTTNARQWFCPTCVDYVPTNLLFVDRYQGQVPTDHPYATPDGLDELPDIAIGRMAVSTASELNNMIEKTKQYEAAQPDQGPLDSWMYNIMFAADNTDEGGDFCTANLNTAEKYFPNKFTDTHLCMDDYDCIEYDDYGNCETWDGDAMRLDMTTALDYFQGNAQSILNYRGHGAVTNWAENLLDIELQSAPYIWSNPQHPTVTISADCLDGNFTPFRWDGSIGSYVDVPALSETFMGLNGIGSVAHWSSTGLGYNSEHTILHEGFYEALFDEDIRPIGDIVNSSKIRYIGTGLGDISEVYTFTLQGDPALKMPFGADDISTYLPLMVLD